LRISPLTEGSRSDSQLLGEVEDLPHWLIDEKLNRDGEI
jgi:hypothetical protein